MFKLRKFARLAFGPLHSHRILGVQSVRITRNFARIVTCGGVASASQRSSEFGREERPVRSVRTSLTSRDLEGAVLRLWRCALMALGVVVSSVGVFGVKSAIAQCNYSIVAEISTPGCSPGSLAPIESTAISDEGVVVGFFFDCAFNEKPFMWSEETGFVAIPLPLGVARAQPRDVSNGNEIVGSLFRPGVGTRAFHYKDGLWTELPPTGTGIHSEAFGINDDGWVCGYRDTDQGRLAFRWLGDIVEELTSPIGGGAVAISINESAIATGGFGTLTVGGLGFLWEQRSATTVPPVKGTSSSEGRAINFADVATGWARPKFMGGPVPTRSWIFDDGQLTDLGEFEGNIATRSNDINDAGQIVGESATATETNNIPFLWQHGKLFDMRTLVLDLPTDSLLRRATATNSLGHIVVEDSQQLQWLVLAPLGRPLGDVNIDCTVDDRDLIAVLADWGPTKSHHPTDQVTSATFEPPADGVVDAADLAVVLGNWSISTEASVPKRRR